MDQNVFEVVQFTSRFIITGLIECVCLTFLTNWIKGQEALQQDYCSTKMGNRISPI
jgi:hypothetical protein